MSDFSVFNTKIALIRNILSSTNGFTAWTILLHLLAQSDSDVFLVPSIDVFGKHSVHQLDLEFITYGNIRPNDPITRGNLVNCLFHAKVNRKHVAAILVLESIGNQLSDKAAQIIMQFAHDHSIPLIIEDGKNRSGFEGVLKEESNSVPLVWLTSSTVQYSSN